MVAKKWSTYANSYGAWLGELFNKDMQRVLKAGIAALVRNTKQDSGLAAYHWIIVPNRGNVSPGSWKQARFTPVYGNPPVGHKGDKGRNSEAVIRAVIEREWSRSISRAVKGRNPATSFKFKNSIPEELTGYKENAKLKRAEQAALSVMRRKQAAQRSRNNLRKNPLV